MPPANSIKASIHSIHKGITSETASTALDIRCEYSVDSVDSLLLSDHVLAVFGFDRGASGPTLDQPLHSTGSQCGGSDVQPLDPRYIDTGLTLIGQKDLREVWYSPVPVSFGVDADVRWASNGHLLLVSVAVELSGEDVQAVTYDAYKHLLRVMVEHGCPRIIRAWNYLPDINAGEGDDERYKHFCSGRHEAFIEKNHDLLQFPAACALGCQSGPMVIYLLASAEPALHFENPQQVSAYHYPREYGPRSPSFARAALKSWSSCSHVYISGTASIIGHQSLHEDDVSRQLEVTFDNIDRLLMHIQSGSSLPLLPRVSMLKVYIRHVDDYALIRDAVEQQYGINTPVVYVQADICRQELAVEIDGLCVIPTLGA